MREFENPIAPGAEVGASGADRAFLGRSKFSYSLVAANAEGAAMLTIKATAKPELINASAFGRVDVCAKIILPIFSREGPEVVA